MPLQKLEGFLQRCVRQAAERRWFLSTCGLLAFIGTLTAAFPVTAVVIPAVLLVPTRWWQITLASTLGSALGATALVEIVHHVGWTQIYEWFPQLVSNPKWQEVMDWATEYGVVSLFFLAASPLPQTPALILFGVTGHHVIAVFFAISFGKILKYGLMAWLASHFPEKFFGREKNLTAPSLQALDKVSSHETKH